MTAGLSTTLRLSGRQSDGTESTRSPFTFRRREVAERIVQRSFAAWGEVAAEIDGRVERDIKAIREAE